MFKTLKQVESYYQIDFKGRWKEEEVLYLVNNKVTYDVFDERSVSYNPDILIFTGLLNQGCKEYKRAEKYYLKALELGDDSAIMYLGDLFRVQRSYKKMKKYYSTAIFKSKNTKAMNHLGYYHYNVTKNYEEMERYYLMGLDLGDSESMYLMGEYHYFISKNFKEMEKYYLMASELRHGDAAYYLANYYLKKEKYQEIENLYKTDLELGNIRSFYKLKFYFNNIKKIPEEMDKYCLIAIEQGFDEAYHELETTKGFLEFFEMTTSIEIPEKHLPYHNNQINKHIEDLKFYLKTKFQNKNTLHLRLYDDLLNGENNKRFLPNFTIYSLDKTHHIHDFVLSSDFFLNLLLGQFSYQDNIKMNYKGEVIDDFIRWLYTKEFNNPEALMELADEYLIEDLRKVCLIKIKYEYLI